MLTTTYQNASIIGLRITKTFRWLIKVAYQFQITTMNDKSKWPKVDLGFEMIPPPLQRAAGRPRKQRIKASGEPGKRGPYQCKRCFQFGHIEKSCNATQAELEQELPPPRPKKGKKPR